MAKTLSTLSQDERKSLLNELLSELTGGRAGAKMVSAAAEQPPQDIEWVINFGCGKQEA